MSDEQRSSARWWFQQVSGLAVLAGIIYVEAWVKPLPVLAYFFAGLILRLDIGLLKGLLK